MLWHFLVVMVINLFFQCLHVDTGHAIHFFPVLDQNEGGDVSDPVFLENKICQGSLKNSELDMDQKLTKNRQKWNINGPDMDQKRTRNGHKMHQKWTKMD